MRNILKTRFPYVFPSVPGVFSSAMGAVQQFVTAKAAVTSRFTLTLTLFALFLMLTGIACNKANDETKATPAKVVAAVEPAEPDAKNGAKKDAPPPVGKEIKPATGPALKSIEPKEGTILGGVLNEIAKELPQPDPEAAKTANESGTVTVEVIVSEKGEVTTLSVVDGPTSLWSAAGKAARKARFDPPLHDGKPVKVAGVLTYEFKK